MLVRRTIGELSKPLTSKTGRWGKPTQGPGALRPIASAFLIGTVGGSSVLV